MVATLLRLAIASAVVLGGATTAVAALPSGPPPVALDEVVRDRPIDPYPGSDPRYTFELGVGQRNATLTVWVHYSLFANPPEAGALQVIVSGRTRERTVAATAAEVRLRRIDAAAPFLRDPLSHFSAGGVWALNLSAVGVRDRGSAGLEPSAAAVPSLLTARPATGSLSPDPTTAYDRGVARQRHRGIDGQRRRVGPGSRGRPAAR